MRFPRLRRASLEFRGAAVALAPNPRLHGDDNQSRLTSVGGGPYDAAAKAEFCSMATLAVSRLTAKHRRIEGTMSDNSAFVHTQSERLTLIQSMPDEHGCTSGTLA